MNLKQLLCRHSYADSNLISFPAGRDVILVNKCVKCGKIYSVRLKADTLDAIIEQDIKRKNGGK